MWSKGVHIPSANGDLIICAQIFNSNGGTMKSLLPRGGMLTTVIKMSRLKDCAAAATSTPIYYVKKKRCEVPNKGFMDNPLVERSLSGYVAGIGNRPVTITNSASKILRRQGLHLSCECLDLLQELLNGFAVARCSVFIMSLSCCCRLGLLCLAASSSISDQFSESSLRIGATSGRCLLRAAFVTISANVGCDWFVYAVVSLPIRH